MRQVIRRRWLDVAVVLTVVAVYVSVMTTPNELGPIANWDFERAMFALGEAGFFAALAWAALLGLRALGLFPMPERQT